MTATGILYFISCFTSNKRRDRIHGRISDRPGMDVAGIEADLDDSTDHENNKFRYSY
jgi:hypothetical protein